MYKIKLQKKHTVVIGIFIIVLMFFFLWNNILILDDSHCTYSDAASYSADTIEQTTDAPESSDGKAGSPSPSDSKNANDLPVKKGHHIHINLDTYTMYVYKDGELVKTYPVSGGKPSSPSPLGTWKIISKDTWGEGFGGAWLGFNVPWGKYGIHGTVYPWFIGKSNSSKGCIRMLNKDVKELYKLVPHGTTVSISHANPVFRVLKSGDIGSDVKTIQIALHKLGYYTGSIDGKYGTGLKNSVRKFQKDNKLAVSGIIYKKTHNLIIEKYQAAVPEGMEF